MAIKTAAVTVTTTATAVTAADSDDLRGQGFAFNNTGSAVVYVGGSDVTASGATQGWPIAAGGTFAFDSASSGDVPYLVTASGTSTVVVFRTGA